MFYGEVENIKQALIDNGFPNYNVVEQIKRMIKIFTPKNKHRTTPPSPQTYIKLFYCNQMHYNYKSSLRVFRVFSSSLQLFPQRFDRYVLWPSLGVCQTRESSLNFASSKLLRKQSFGGCKFNLDCRRITIREYLILVPSYGKRNQKRRPSWFQ